MSASPHILNEIMQLKETLRLLKQEDIILKSDGLRFYEPAGPKHDLFHRKGNYKYRYLRCGNRFGKTELGVAEDVAWALGERRWIPATDPARFLGIPKRPIRLLIVCESWKKADDVLTNLAFGKFWKYIPKESYLGCTVEHGGHIDSIKIKSIWGGTSMISIQTIASYKQSPQVVESSPWDAIHIDEPCPEQLWKGASRGLMDTGGSAWFTCTPLIHPWINRFFIPPGREVTDKTEPFSNEKKFIITGSSYDNSKLTKENIDDYAKTLTKEERETRLFGIPSGAGGLVYPEFDRVLHVYTEDSLPSRWKAVDDPPRTTFKVNVHGETVLDQPGYMIRAAIDTHERTPQAVLFEATIGTGQEAYIYYFKEVFESRLIHVTCNVFNEVVQGRNLLQVLIDQRAYIESPIDDSCLADEFANHGVIGEKAPKDLKRGILKVKEMLKKRDAAGNPVVFFSEGLAETLFEFEEYVWDAKKPDSPVDQNDHMMENLYRLLITHPGFVNLDGKEVSFIGQTPVDDNPDLSLHANLDL